MTDERTGAAGELLTLALEKKGAERVRAVLNVLTESTFFYREDDPDLFLFLVRNKSGVRKFVEHFFGWRLHVDRHVARLIKERQYNDRLRPTQRDIFDLRRRDECLLFAILLEFHEEEVHRQNVSPDDERPLRFLLSDFVAFALRRFREEMGEACPSEQRIFEAVKPLFLQLDRHRFVRLVDRKAAEAGEELPAGMEEHSLYEFLPGIRCYDASQAAREIVIRAYRTAAPGEEAPGSDGAPSSEDGSDGDGA
ncbi:MAG: hypothetical protein AUK27_08680 [Deltaproteobacteria bacterium CG2_30_66_27]|nr:MAG: hypothetical protein AUK27_08680 [Deltaproteobacteria bacterium CG2_30_66_27]